MSFETEIKFSRLSVSSLSIGVISDVFFIDICHLVWSCINYNNSCNYKSS